MQQPASYTSSSHQVTETAEKLAFKMQSTVFAACGMQKVFTLDTHLGSSRSDSLAAITAAKGYRKQQKCHLTATTVFSQQHASLQRYGGMD